MHIDDKLNFNLHITKFADPQQTASRSNKASDVPNFEEKKTLIIFAEECLTFSV